MRDIKHLLIVGVLFVVVICGFLLVRSRMTPKSFGKFGHYRAAAVDEIKTLPLHYAGQKECATCHEKQAKEKAGSSHRTLSCETCHGALQAHLEDPAGVKPAKPPEGEMRSFCGTCHTINISRPRQFPQVNLYEHNPGLMCTQCHSPHEPKL